MGWLKIQKLEYLENKTIFLRNKKILNLCLRQHILRSYRFVAEVTLNVLLSRNFLNEMNLKLSFGKSVPGENQNCLYCRSSKAFGFS